MPVHDRPIRATQRATERLLQPDQQQQPNHCQAFRKYLECGIFAHGFTKARCDDCGHDYFVAISCKGQGVCPSCDVRRRAESAAHLTDHIFPRLPVRQCCSLYRSAFNTSYNATGRC